MPQAALCSILAIGMAIYIVQLRRSISLCTLIGKIAELASSRTLIDVGSGYGAPALQWGMEYRLRNIVCVNTNFHQLIKGSKIVFDKNKFENSQLLLVYPQTSHIANINSTSLYLPFANNTVDRIVALEAAQHFKPIDSFITESYRILQPKGLLVIADACNSFFR